MGLAEVLRQPRRLLAEKQPAVRRESGLRVILRSLGGGQPQIGQRFGMLAEQIVQPVVVPHLHQMPVVQTGPLHSPVGNIKAQRADQMQTAAGGGAGAGDVAAVLWDLRLHQHNVQHDFSTPFIKKLP